jgi:hypothetical protein
MPVASADDAAGFGFSAQQSELIAANPSLLTCAGTTQATAAVIKSRNSELSPAASQTGAIPPSTAKVMAPYFLNNQQSTTAVVYVPVGHYLNSVLNASVNLVQYKSIILYQYKKGYWAYNLSA